jgi:glucose/arabinose dehydrogenase
LPPQGEDIGLNRAAAGGALAATAFVFAACHGSGDESTSRAAAHASNPGPPQLELVGRFQSPVFLAERPGADGGLYVVERDGRVVPADGGRPLLDITDRVLTKGEAGMLSVAFPPRNTRGGHFYVAYSGRDRRLHVDEFDAGPGEAAKPSSRREVLAIEHPNFVHWGGLLMFGPDGGLYLGTGDGGPPYPIPDTAQDPSSPLGKLLRVDRSATGAEVIAMGLRNPWRYSFDRKTEDLWIGDVGDFTQEEVDHVPLKQANGSNFGWPDVEGTAQTKSDVKAKGPVVAPAYTYKRSGTPDDPVCAVTGGYVVRDPDLPSLAGRYLYGDFCDGKIRAATVKRSGSLGAVTSTALRVQSLASFAEDLDGQIYAISLNGPVYRIVRR